METSDGSGLGAFSRSRELLGAAADVPLSVFLPPEPGVQPGPEHRFVPLPWSLRRPPSLPAEAPSAPDPAPRPAGGQRATPTAPSSAPHVRRPGPAHAAAVKPGRYTLWDSLKRLSRD